MIYNHMPGLPPRVLLASLSCSENTAFKRSARLFCWKTTPTTLSLQVTWKQRKALYEGQVGHPPRNGPCMGCEPALNNSNWTLPDDDKSRVPAGWLHTGRLTLSLCTLEFWWSVCLRLIYKDANSRNHI